MTGISEAYDVWADCYERLYPSVDRASHEHRRSIGRKLEETVSPGRRVIEVGCGIGLCTIALAELGYDVVGIDISGASLDRARGLLGERGLSAELHREDILNSPEVGPADAVIGIGSLLAHMTTRRKQEAAVRAMADMLEPGGTLLLGLHDYATLLVRERDDAFTPTIHVRHARGETIFFQRRRWRGNPRSRVHRCTHYLILDKKRLRTITMQSRAITQKEVTEILTAAGLRDIHWLPPAETGYYQPLCAARKT